MERLFKFVSVTFVGLAVIGISFGVFNLFTQFLKELNLNISENSLINDLSQIDYLNFYRIGFISLLTFSAILSVANIILTFTVSETMSAKILIPLFKTSLVLSIVVPMLFVLTKEQFNVITTLISFLALFSFIVPKKFFKKSKKE